MNDEALRASLRAIADWCEPTAPLSPALRPYVIEPYQRRKLWPALGAAAASVALIVGLLSFVRSDDANVAAARGRWSALAPSPLSPRINPAVAWTGSEMLVIGGIDGADGLTPLTDGAAYNPDSNRWRPLPDMPAKRAILSSVWTGEELIVFGALKGPRTSITASSPPWASDPNLPDVRAFDPATNAWRVLPPFGAHGPAVAYDEASNQVLALYVRPPVVQFHQLPDFQVAGTANVDVAEPALQLWDGLQADGIALFVPTHRVANFNPSVVIVVEAGAFSTYPPIRQGSGSMAYAFAADEKALYAIGEATDGKVTRFAGQFDLDTRTWTEATPPPDSPLNSNSIDMTVTVTPYGLMALGGLDPGKGSVIGGLTTRGGIALAADLELKRWQRLPQPPIDLRRVGHAAVWTGKEVLVYGGSVRRGSVANIADTAVNDGARWRING